MISSLQKHAVFLMTKWGNYLNMQSKSKIASHKKAFVMLL